MGNAKWKWKRTGTGTGEGDVQIRYVLLYLSARSYGGEVNWISVDGWNVAAELKRATEGSWDRRAGEQMRAIIGGDNMTIGETMRHIPHPHQVGFPSFGHETRLHMFPLILDYLVYW